MKFTATDEQVRMMAALASQHSKPMGMGLYHYNSSTKFVPTQFEFEKNYSGKRQMYCDYVEGRMVKLCLNEVEEGVWEPNNDTPNSEYQSWSHKYPTYRELVEAAGGKVV